jgi:hypothetical protein
VDFLPSSDEIVEKSWKKSGKTIDNSWDNDGTIVLYIGIIYIRVGAEYVRRGW